MLLNRQVTFQVPLKHLYRGSITFGLIVTSPPQFPVADLFHFHAINSSYIEQIHLFVCVLLLTFSLVLNRFSSSKSIWGVFPMEPRKQASSSLTRERISSVRLSLLLRSSFWLFNMLFSSWCIIKDNPLNFELKIEIEMLVVNALLDQKVLWTCLDFCMVVNALLEVLLARQLAYFSFELHYLLLLIDIFRLKTCGYVKVKTLKPNKKKLQVEKLIQRS